MSLFELEESDARILNTLALNYRRRFYVGELGKKLGIPKATLFKSIIRLKSQDCISRDTEGGHAYISLCEDNVIAAMLTHPIVNIQGIKIPFIEVACRLVSQLNKGSILNAYSELGIIGSLLSTYVEFTDSSFPRKKSDMLRAEIDRSVLRELKENKSGWRYYTALATILPILEGIANPTNFAVFFLTRESEEFIPHLSGNQRPKAFRFTTSPETLVVINDIIDSISVRDHSGDIAQMVTKLADLSSYLHPKSSEERVMSSFGTTLRFLAGVAKKTESESEFLKTPVLPA